PAPRLRRRPRLLDGVVAGCLPRGPGHHVHLPALSPGGPEGPPYSGLQGPPHRCGPGLQPRQPLMHPLIHDWNKTDAPKPATVMLDDETLRDGLQSPSVRTPSIDEKLKIL